MSKFCRFFAKYKRNFHFPLRKSMEPLKPIPKHEVFSSIELTSSEKELFSLFTTFVNEEALQTTLRVAGGWVRDKLLGKECKDIDITLDNMTGEEFITKAKAYFLRKNCEHVHGFGVTKLNPDKSKHLETATARVKDMWIDFVNLRGETYDPATRVPTMRLGTAEEDAFRRDLTINSLFYNLMSNQVEDFTKQGLEDLRNGVIRTPLEPYKTFLDDPLRILRTFRFASRFGFQVEKNIVEVLKSDEILDALRNKVSRERIGIELNLILNHESVFECLTHYYKNRLWDIVFEVKSIMKDFSKEFIEKKCFEGFSLCKTVFEHKEMLLDQFKILNEHLTKKNVLFYAYLTAAVLPYSEYKFQKNKQTPSLISYIIKESVKFPNKEHNLVLLLDSCVVLINDIVKTNNPVVYRNKVINWIKTNAETWELSFFLCYMQQKTFASSDLQNVDKNFKELYEFVYKEKLAFIFQIKPFLDGGEIIKLFQLKPGPTIKLVQDNLFYWQVENQEKSKADLLKEISDNKENFLIRRD